MLSPVPHPEHWWTPIHDPEKPYWEILPQEASAPEVIISKRHELGILSNFTLAPFVFRGKRYRSVEGLWQSMFYPEDANDPRAKFQGITWPHAREEVSQMIAFEAQLAGEVGEANMKAMGINWVSFEGERMEYWTPEKGAHYRLVVEAMRAKMEQNPKVQEMLLSTGNLILRPDHHRPADCPPSWKYEEIWMLLREELRQTTH